jgi:hypothetical protein
MIKFAVEKQKLADNVSKSRNRRRNSDENINLRRTRREDRRKIFSEVAMIAKRSHSHVSYRNTQKKSSINQSENHATEATISTIPTITNFCGKALSLRTARQIKNDVALHRGKPIPEIL